MVWKSPESVFPGGAGTAELRQLFGKKVRLKEQRRFKLHSKKTDKGEDVHVTIPKLAQAFIGYVPNEEKDTVTLAFPQHGPLPASIAKFPYQSFHDIRVNWMTLKFLFEIDW